jgi:voltage-gated potassium channel
VLSEQTELLGAEASLLRRTRRFEAAKIDERMRPLIVTATLLVIPVLLLEAQPLGAPWHTVAVLGDWLIWLVFLAEFAAVLLLAHDWRSWLRSYPLAPALIILTPPFAPASVQALRLYRLLRLVRLARGYELLSKLLTIDGLKVVIALSLFLVVGGGSIFADIESHQGHHVSTWDGIWWAIGTVTTEGSNVEVTTTAGRIIGIALMLAGIGVVAVMTGAIAQHFLASRASASEALSRSEQAIMDRLDELAGRLHAIENTQLAGTPPAHNSSQQVTQAPRAAGDARQENSREDLFDPTPAASNAPRQLP